MEGILMMTATISPTERKYKAIAANGRTTEHYPGKTRMSARECLSGVSFATLSERPDHLSGRSDSDSGDDERHQKARRRKLRVAYSLNDLLTRADGYFEYKLVSDKSNYQKVCRRIFRF